MAGDRQSDSSRVGAVAFRAAVVLLAALSFLPIADWIPGDPGTNMPPPIWPMYLLWVLGLVVLGAAAWGGARALAWFRGRRRAEPAEPSPAGFWVPSLLLITAGTLLYAQMSWSVFDARPLHIDAMTQAVQAHVLAGGDLGVPAPDDPRFFSSSLVVEHEGRAFSQFPPGWAVLLALGFLAGLPWLVAPLLGAVAVVAFHAALRENGESGRRAFAAAALFGLSPWFAFNAASWMSHVPALAFILVGSAALLRSMRGPGSVGWAAGGGVALGIATMIRPLEGVAFGLPATVWVLARAWRARAELRTHPAMRTLAGFAAGGTLAIATLLAYNLVQHGSPTLFGFELQWGPEHRLGFHEAPWGPPHTLVRGIELMNGYLIGLQLLFFDAPAPSLLLAFAALLLVRRLDALDRYLLAGCGLVVAGYVSFWGEGHDLGPRYLIPLAPLVALWSVRFGGLLAERTGRPHHRTWGHGLVVLLLVAGWVFGTPTRWFVYSRSDPLRRVDPGILTTPRAREALVFVPTPWSLQVQARLRATGMSRQQAEWFYYRVGLCKLDVALSQLEDRAVTDPDRVVAALRPLAADSTMMVVDRVAGTPGHPYTGLTEQAEAAVALCQLRQERVEAQGGYMLLPFTALLGPMWSGDGPILAHDLHEENRRLLEAYPERDAFWLRAVRVRADGVREFALEPLDPDSTAAVWGTFERLQREASIF